MELKVEFDADEQSAIDAAVARQQASEPGLTAELLVARMAKKLAMGWASQVAEKETDRHLTEIGARLRTLPTPDRLALVEKLTDAMNAGLSR